MNDAFAGTAMFEVAGHGGDGVATALIGHAVRAAGGDETAVFLAGLSHKERLNWMKEYQYPYPISFEREIGGTVYAVNTHFSDTAVESPEQKTFRILTKI